LTQKNEKVKALEKTAASTCKTQVNGMIISMIITAFGKGSSKLDFALSYCNNLQAQLSTFPFTKGFAALLMLLFLRPWRFYLAVWDVVACQVIM
jgi:hypothetical protein